MGYWLTIVGFFGGMFIIALIDRFIPKGNNPHEVKSVEDVQNAQQPRSGRDGSGSFNENGFIYSPCDWDS